MVAGQQSSPSLSPPATSGNAHAPSISLPKGGGAIRGIGEKFAANPVTGTGSLNVPIATSPGRSGFGPQLSLSYDSGYGNGPFGFGWSLSIPSVARKTDKGLPRYRDAEESDVFILSGAEDLVPVLQPDGTAAAGYIIHRYCPRIEGLFARIERWTNQETGEIHWRSITRDNITSLYGKDNHSRIFDPNDPDPAHPTRVFGWLICESYDDKGNAIVYEYKAENSDSVDLSQVHEKNRSDSSRSGNRYLKCIKYGNRVSRLAQPDLTQADWMFEVVFDYDEDHYEELPLDSSRPEAEQHRFVHASASPGRRWAIRPEPFSTYRAGFEVRTYRRCHRVLMFHRFAELGSEPYLVRSTEFEYADFDYSRPPTVEAELAHPGSTRFASFIRAIAHSGFVRADTQAVLERNGVKYVTYLKKSLPPLEFEYSKASIQDDIRELDAGSLENLPVGLDGATYQWVDLDGEGVSGILTEQAGAWFYKPNLGDGRFGPLQTVAAKPSLADLSSGRQQLLDLAGDGQLDLVALAGPTPGFYERTYDEDWEPFRAFRQLPNIPWDEPNLRFVDLDGDGHADVLITEQDVFTWHPSLAEEGFGPARSVRQPLDEERGPRLVLADGTQSIYLADMCGDGLTDLVRIRNGEVCYWPNLGCGRFGAKVTMDNAPWFDNLDQFDQRRIRLADIDGSGTSDIIYLGCDGVRLHFNQSGNRLSEARRLAQFPRVDNISSVMTADLLGNGTACLVWSSPLPADARQPLRYIDLMGGAKPHLLIKSVNNLGAETQVHYAPSARFYLSDKRDGRPWVTRLPFPVHVVERVVTHDHISGNQFVTRYAYHHGYFNGIEREFRGFGMVEQWDTEEFAALNAGGQAPAGTNVEASSHVPPVLTKTWFHTGVYLGRGHVSDFFAGLLDAQDTGEYYREPGLTDQEAANLGLDDEARRVYDDARAKERLLDDTVLPDGLTVDEEREACRALKGSMLRQEVYALDGTDKQQQPYTVTEQNFTIRVLQRRGDNRHAVFFTHARESISYQYERNPTDPRIAHALTLDVDEFGNVLKSVAIGYGRRQGQSPLQGDDKKKQEHTLITYTENDVTNPIDDAAVYPDDYRTPLPAETRTYELTGFKPENSAARFSFDEWTRNDFALPASAAEIHYEQTANNTEKQKRLIEQVRTLYRPDDLGTAQNDPLTLLLLCELEPLALPGESYMLAFTPGLLTQVFQRDGEPLLPDPANVLGGHGASQGGYLDLDGDSHWWIPSGRAFFSPHTGDGAAQELAHARQHFFLPHRYRDPFHTNAVSTESFVAYDAYDLLMLESRDPLGNRVTVGERLANGDLDPTKLGNDYRVLQPRLVTDPNGNRTRVSFDALGMVVGTAVMGKPEENLGDSLDGLDPDLTQAQVDGFYEAAEPQVPAVPLLKGATMRIIYDLDRFRRTQRAHPEDPTTWLPVYAATLARETHVSDPLPAQGLKIQTSFSYSDGFGREIQKKIQAEPGPLVEGGPVVSPRWVGSGWTIFNNKGKPVRQYEPFFSQLPEKRHRFEFGVQVGVSPILFYDPAERVIATLHPNHTWEKVAFDPWRQETWDVNDTVLVADPNSDADVGAFFSRLANADYLPTWHALRTDPAHAAESNQRWPDPKTRDAEKRAAEKTSIHTATPTVAYADTLGRTFLTIVHDKFKYSDSPPDDPPVEEFHRTRILLDIEGNQREIIDAKDRVVMRYDYDLLGNRIHQASMEAGERWMLNDVTGKPIRAWDCRGHTFRTEYDPLRRPMRSFVTSADPANPNHELLTERLVYGEQHSEDELRNLRGRLYLHLDQAGAVSNEAHDFKGNLLRASRRLAREYKQAINGSAVDAALPANGTVKLNPAALEAALSPLLEADTFTTRTTYDALNRPTTLRTPDNSVIRPGYNEANLLERVEVNLRGAAVVTPFVTDIDYNAKGQRTLTKYRNGVRTTYEYDPLTFRLVHLLTWRNAIIFPDDCPRPPPADWPGCQVQNLHYTYDPAGNIAHISDDAQQTIYFRNKRVEPSAEYTYDALYRLIEATGREHLGQTGGQPNPPTAPDPFNGFHTRLDHLGDGNAMGTYVEQYVYDAVGNILAMQHRGSDPAHPGWTHAYAYNEASQLEGGKVSNRLSGTTIRGGAPETYAHDAHGNMTRMPHLPLMQWDYRDQLQATAQQVVNNGGTPETTYYVYDSAGQRVRKVTERQAAARQTPTRKAERIYLGGFEIYREYGGDGSTVTLERETLHLMDDKQRIALVETRTKGNDDSPPQLIRYQFGNHLGSASLELDDQAQIISYEEYTPYGNTSYQAVRSQTETPKRYRYAGKERDEESGLYYHGARYYAPWVGRWPSPDPGGTVDGANLYSYCSDDPVCLVDDNGEQGGPPGQTWFYEHRVYFQQVIATATGRGFARTVKENAQRIYEIWGGKGKADLAHVEKPYALTRAGEPTTVVPQERSVNRSYAATEKRMIQEARAKGQFARAAGVDPTATKGRRFGQPRQPAIFESGAVKNWKTPTPQVKPVAALSSRAPATSAPAQLELPFPKAEPSTGQPPSAALSTPRPSAGLKGSGSIWSTATLAKGLRVAGELGLVGLQAWSSANKITESYRTEGFVQAAKTTVGEVGGVWAGAKMAAAGVVGGGELCGPWCAAGGAILGGVAGYMGVTTFTELVPIYEMPEPKTLVIDEPIHSSERIQKFKIAPTESPRLLTPVTR